MADDKDLPFRAEYAKSSRASCKVCKTTIMKEELRMGIMVQSHQFDAKIPNWHHIKCFFKKKLLQSAGDVANFQSLRWDDQKLIKDNIVGVGANVSSKSGEAAGSMDNSEFSMEYAKSSRSVCRHCSEKIMKGDIRISKIEHDSESAQRYGPQKGWHHVDCFVKRKKEFGFSESAEKIPGFSMLSNEDQTMLLGKIVSEGRKRKQKPSESVAKKSKIESEEEKGLQAQSALIYGFRDKLQNQLNKKEWQLLLEHNDQEVFSGESRVLDLLADCITFGALKPCPECKKGQLKFRNDGYYCTGHLTGWTKCQYSTKSPERSEFKIPVELAEEYDFLKKYKYVERKRVLPTNPEIPSSQQAVSSGAKGPLAHFKVAIVGDLKKSKEQIAKKISDMGGKLVTKIDSSLTCILSTQDEVDMKSKKILNAKKHNVHVVSEKFLDEVKNGGAALMMKQNMLSTWGGDPLDKIAALGEKSQSRSSKAFLNANSGASRVVKVTTDGSACVDNESGLAEKAAVYQNDKGVVFNAVLNKVDISRGTNSYYKLQLLKAKTSSRYWVYRSWGRVGTAIGSNKLEKFDTVADALEAFKECYLEKTGNEWKNRDNFVKCPGLFYPLDIDYGQHLEELQKAKKLKPGSKSVLPKPVQELICLIFDVEAMKNAMVEFEIDLKKMPLGKLSKKQVEMAFKVLNELQQLLQGGKNPTMILDASNRFYTLIPHDFGLKKPAPLDNEVILKSKIDMLDSLLEIEFAYNLLKESDDSIEDPVDRHYCKLRTDIKPLDKTSKEFDYIHTYLHNTHAKTHSSYALELEDVFKIDREGESLKYKKFEELKNKKLLWHGSRITNFAGILSQGLRIAPPEAPSTGYMFGKGIYFADMVSKSANYCFTSRSNPTGILLLCEVALGDMYEKADSEYIEKLPKNKHSTKGLGQTAPNPTSAIFTDDGVEIPLGKPCKTSVKNSSLLYNEYIVYDVGQVNIKYLLKVNFNYKH